MSRSSAASAFALDFRTRHRWGLPVLGAYLAVLAAIKLYVVARGIVVRFDSGEQFAIAVVVPMTILAVYALAVFTYGFAGDAAARQSMYPPRLFSLPLSNAALAGWPMLFGATAIVLLWFATRALVIWPERTAIPVFWPAALAAAMMGWAQALLWMPYGFVGARVVIAMLWLSAIDVIVMIALQLHAPEWVMLSILTPLIPLAYLTARFAVARARRGDVPDWTRGAGRETRVAVSTSWTSRLSPRTPRLTQTWFEWRENGLTLPAIVAMLLPFELLVLEAAGNTSLVLEIFAIVAVTPPFMAAFVAASIRTAPPFPYARPLSSAELIGAKLRAAALSTALTWAIVAVIVPIGVWLTDATPAVVQRWDRLVRFMGEPRAIVLVAFVVLVLMLATWRQLVQTLFIGLSGRAWLVKAYVALTLVVISVLGPVLEWLQSGGRLLCLIWDGLPVLLALAVAIRLAVAIWLTVRLSRSRLVRDHTIVAGAAIWCAAVLALYALLVWWWDTDLFPRHLMALVAILVVPLVRFAASPLALAWSRHR